LDDQGKIPGGVWIYFRHRIQTDSEAQAASYPMGNGGSSLGDKQPRHEADHSPPSKAEVKE